MKRFLLIALVLSLTLPVVSLSACGETMGNTDTTAGQNSDGDSTTDDPLTDNLPDVKYDGYEFRFYTFGDYGSMYTPAEEDGDIVNDATYRRNRTVEERFDVRIKSVESGALNESEHSKTMEKLLLAGDEAFDVALNNGKRLATQSVSGYYLNLYDVEHLDFTKPWWSSQLVEDLTFMNCMFVCSSNLQYEEFAASKVYYFNKTKADEYKIGDLYQTVFDGKWTIDKLISLTRDVYEDVNGDGKHDKGDFYGMLTTISHNSWAVVFDIPVWTKKADSIEISAMSSRMLDAFDIIKEWYFDSDGLYTWKSYSDAKDEMRQMFIDGRGLFTFGFVGDSGTYYRTTDVDYGMLPFPKYNEEQKSYRVFYGANSSNMFAVPKLASDPSRTGVIIEALSAEGYKQLIPVYYEIALKAKYLRDEDSNKMLDLITNARTISFSYCYDKWDAGLGFGNCFGSSSAKSFATFYAGRENLVKERIEEVTEAFKNHK